MTIHRLLVASALMLGLIAGGSMAATLVSQITFERSNAVVTVAGADGVNWKYDFLSIDAAIAAYSIGSNPGGAARGVSWVVDEVGGKDADYLAIDLALPLSTGMTGTHVEVQTVESIMTTTGACQRVTLTDVGQLDACDARIPAGYPNASATVMILQAGSLQPSRATLVANPDGTTMQLRFQLINRMAP